MNNHITASIEFYFKGKNISSSVSLNLDQHMQSSGKLPALYQLLAREINLDLYSYEYEMMQAETIIFSQSKGLVTEYINDGLLDIEAFETAWVKNNMLKKLENIAQKNLSIDDLAQHPDLKNALLKAYQLGEQAK